MIMKNYFFNFLLTAVVALVSGILVFLVGNQVGTMVAAAITSGVIGGLTTGISYNLGCMVHEDGGKFNGKRLLIMVITGILFGVLGGWMMGL